MGAPEARRAPRPTGRRGHRRRQERARRGPAAAAGAQARWAAGPAETGTPLLATKITARSPARLVSRPRLSTLLDAGTRRLLRPWCRARPVRARPTCS